MTIAQRTMSTIEAGELLGITRQAVQQLLKSGTLQGEQRGASGTWFVLAESVERRLIEHPRPDTAPTPSGPITEQIRDTMRGLIREEMPEVVQNGLREVVGEFLRQPAETLAREGTVSGPLTMTLQSKLEKPMDVKEAVRTAKEYLVNLYEGENITDIGLEEVVFNDESDNWNITIGFSRPWDTRNDVITSLRLRRSYKVVSIDDTTGRVESLTDRILNATA